MAKKKKTEEVEEIQAVEEIQPAEETVVEEKPKAKKTKKKAETPVEEPAVEEQVTEKIEEPVVEEAPVEEPVVVEEPKKEEPKVEVKVDMAETSDFTSYMGLATGLIQIRKAPTMQSTVIGNISKGSKVVILEIDGNWARIGKDRWININYIEKV